MLFKHVSIANIAIKTNVHDLALWTHHMLNISELIA